MSARIVLKSAHTRRRARIRSKISGTAARPRLAVFRSLRHISAQLIDDTTHATLAAASDLEIKDLKAKSNRKVELAFEVGKLVAQKAKAKKITAVVFDRGGYRYHGRIKALADGARAGELQF